MADNPRLMSLYVMLTVYVFDGSVTGSIVYYTIVRA